MTDRPYISLKRYDVLLLLGEEEERDSYIDPSSVIYVIFLLAMSSNHAPSIRLLPNVSDDTYFRTRHTGSRRSELAQKRCRGDQARAPGSPAEVEPPAGR